MRHDLLTLLRCPFCGTQPSLINNNALVQASNHVESGVLSCACCAFPVVAGIPVMVTNETTTKAMHELEAGHPEAAFLSLLELDKTRTTAFRKLLQQDKPITYRQAVDILSSDEEGTYFFYRFTDPTYLLAKALLETISQESPLTTGMTLDLCGGSGHLTRVMTSCKPTKGVVLADKAFWKLWLATHFVAPECNPVCCDANQPLPFPRETFSMVTLSDAFSYIWQKRLLSEEMMRICEPAGAIVIPHVHNALGANFSAGLPLEPAAYQELLSPCNPHLFSDRTLLNDFLKCNTLDLKRNLTPETIGREPSLTIVATEQQSLFREYSVTQTDAVTGSLQVNPLYRVTRQGNTSVLTLTFPTPEYEEEFRACQQYLKDTVTVNADLTNPISLEELGSDAKDLMRRYILIDAPPHYY